MHYVIVIIITSLIFTYLNFKPNIWVINAYNLYLYA